MARIKITDIPKDQKISKDELKRIRGGAVDMFLTTRYNLPFLKVTSPTLLNSGLNAFPKVESTPTEIKW
ncbi:MAG: hypothetical protein JXB48_18770 [Candidatus Latescibacteria bacterium]|nr:hypothetical protein [Candidatus Latescibacterota bacterium]